MFRVPADRHQPLGRGSSVSTGDPAELVLLVELVKLPHCLATGRHVHVRHEENIIYALIGREIIMNTLKYSRGPKGSSYNGNLIYTSDTRLLHTDICHTSLHLYLTRQTSIVTAAAAAYFV